MSLKIEHKDTEFAVGDTIRVIQKVSEGEKKRSHSFEGIVISVKGPGNNKSFTLRRIGVGQIGIEKIFPLFSPTIEKIELLRKGASGTRRAKLYYIRKKSKKEVEKIYSRSQRKEKSKEKAKKTKVKKIKVRKTSKISVAGKTVSAGKSGAKFKKSREKKPYRKR